MKRKFFLLSCLANRSLTGQHHCINTKIVEQQKYPEQDAQVNKKQQYHQQLKDGAF